MGTLVALPCVDSPELAARRRRELDIPRVRAAQLGMSAVEVVARGWYQNQAGERVDLRPAVAAAVARKVSIPPDADLPVASTATHPETRVQVANETTLQASRRLVDRGLRPVALNFANGIQPGGGFLSGARAQEEVLCRSSALYQTLVGDPMYEYHHTRPLPDSTAWTIYSPDVPVFRADDGETLDRPWLLSFLTCAAPYAPKVGQPESGDILAKRIRRLLAVARSCGHEVLVLGAWGCGAFGNDPKRTAADFRQALETDFAGAFSEVAFAITDWSPERKTLGPFRDVLGQAT